MIIKIYIPHYFNFVASELKNTVKKRFPDSVIVAEKAKFYDVKVESETPIDKMQTVWAIDEIVQNFIMNR